MACRAKKLPLRSFLLSPFFICALTSPAFSDTNFYTLAKRWDSQHTSDINRKKTQEADEKSYGITPSKNDFPGAESMPTSVALQRRLEELGGQGIVQIEEKQSLFIKSDNPIVKFVSTEEKVAFESISPEVLRISGTEIGFTFIHIWTESQRYSFQLQVVSQKFAPSASQLSQQEALEKSRSFKIGYTATQDSFYSGERYKEMNRGSLDFTQNMSLEGDTPYGALTSHAQTQKARGKTLLTDAQVSLTDGKIGGLKNFNAALGDSRITSGLMSFPGARVRGAAVETWSDKRRVKSTGFYGREQASVIGTLTPGIESKRTLNSYLRGGVMDVELNKDMKVKGGYFAGTGSSRSGELTKHSGGLKADMNLGPHLGFSPEVDYDTRHFVQKESATLKFDNFRLRGEYRNIAKKFQTIVGAPAAQGELGYLLEGNTILNGVVLTGSVDKFRDRLIPNPEAMDYYNVHTNFSAGFSPWTGSTFQANYQGMDDTGRLGPNRQQTYTALFNQRVKFLEHAGNVFTRYQRRENTILNNNLLDYNVDQATIGYATQLFWDINFSISHQANFLEEPNLPAESRPRVTEYNFDYNKQLGKTPFFMDWRFRVRDEESAESINSAMSGYDTTEFSTSLYYREYANMEIFVTGSCQNYKQESLGVTEPRFELSILTGVRYLFDTQIHWDSVGSFDGYVFKDLNGDGERQPEEPGIEGMLVRTGTKEAVTDKDGFYDLQTISGKKVLLSLDSSKLPYGYVPTTSASQELAIVQGAKRHVNFGVTPRSEVTGIVYNDINGNGKYDTDTDKGVPRVRIALENGTTARTNNLGVYSFPGVIAGTHKASIDFSKLPQGYLPQGIPHQEFTLFEGIRYEVNFPLKAVRIVTGRVYLDANGNQHMDDGEKALPNVKVLMGDQMVSTDKDGWYLFDGLAAGSYELSLDEKTLPAGYPKPEVSKIVLSVEPMTISNADVGLHKAEVV